jgi:Domain of unknown function (DUF5668)
MNCSNHTEVSAVAYCRTCGKALCANCTRDVRGVVYCENCLAERLGGALPPPSVYQAAVADPALGAPAARDRLPSPGVAAALGFIPGVGAMYNGQFMKGFIHVMVFVCLIWMGDHFGPIMVPVFFAYFFYSVFDAYKTAHAIELGQPLPDPFGLERMFGADAVARRVPHPAETPANLTSPPEKAPDQAGCTGQVSRHRAPTGAIVLIALGALFLLNSLGLLEFHWVHRLWPVILIVVGGWLFVKRWYGERPI